MIYKKDLELIEFAKNIIDENHDKVNYNHTIGSAITAVISLCGNYR